ncbi:MAG: hypothetical protein ACRDKG_01880 [Actinomycetota bacterium]
MPRQNRVTPLGELIAHPARGFVYGNRGCLHDADGRIRRRYNGTRWIACRLRFKGWHRSPLMRPGRFTELFFLDDATAMAAGHRACALCRRDDFNRLADTWSDIHPEQKGADAIDAQLHIERVLPEGGRRLYDTPLDGLPDGAFVVWDGEPHIVLDGSLIRWTPGGYTARRRKPSRARVSLITPPSLVAVLRAGWAPVVPLIHESARPRARPTG